MRFRFMSAGILLFAFAIMSGCNYSPDSGLPQHIRTVRVPTFKCNEFYYGLESKLTRAVIEKLVKDPRVKVVRKGEDATLFGVITEVKKSVLRSDKDDRPSSVRLSIEAEISFVDNVEGRDIIEPTKIVSSGSSSSAGVYDMNRGENRSEAETTAIDKLADDIVRRIVGIW